MSGAIAALRLAAAHWRLALGGLGLLVLGVMLASARSDARHWQKQAERYAALYSAERQAHRQTIDDHRRAAALARAEDAAHAARVERDQAIISREVASDYQKNLAALRERYDALRLQQRAAAPSRSDPGAGGTKALPETAPGASGTAQPPGPQGLPPDAGSSAADTADLDWRFLCSAQAEQLDALIDWVVGVSGAGAEAPKAGGSDH